MGIFDRMKEPIFLKDSNNAEVQLEKLKALEPFLNAKGQTIIGQDIKFLEYGIAGEKQIAFELKNSHIPMYILHDIYLEDGELGAQIDYLIFTKKICFIIECKNLYGNIEINSAGDFIRTMEFGGKKKKEGIYSPITQNQRHMELMKKIKYENNSNILTRFVASKKFDDFNKSVVVLANPKTVLNMKYAKKEIKDKIIRADQLVKYIKEMNGNSKEISDTQKGMLAWAESYMKLHKDVEKDYTEKYEQYKIASDEKKNTVERNIINENKTEENTTKVNLVVEEEKGILLVAEPIMETTISLEDMEIFLELKQYRLNKSRELNVKPYHIYSNNQLEKMIFKMPRSKEELLTVEGFGDTKVNTYGEDILEIIGKY